MSSSVEDHHDLSEEEKDWRRREVQAAQDQAKAALDAVQEQKRTVRIQAIALAVGAVATLTAVVVAYFAGRSVTVSSESASQQAAENRLTTAITAIGEKSPTSQVAGLTLLRRNVSMQLDAAMKDPGKRQDAYDAYMTSLEFYHTYLRTTTSPGRDPSMTDMYAAAQLRHILELEPEVKAIFKGGQLHERQLPAIDLSNVGLAGVNWDNIDFSWLAAAYMPGIDLSSADLAGSHWGNATLAGANLQCADLRGADLSSTDLSGADLRGANLTNAQFPAANKLHGVNTDRALSNNLGAWHIDNPGTSYSPYSCR